MEGVTRVDALAAYDIPAAGITGVWNWRTDPVTIPDFESIALKGGQVLLVPDGDVRTNSKVATAVTRFRRWLGAQGRPGPRHGASGRARLGRLDRPQSV